MSVSRNDFLTLWKLATAGDEAKVQEHIAESDAVARNLVNLKHHRKGTSPLMEAAASKCNEPVVAQLIAAGADVNDVDDTKLKNTALHYAAMTNGDPLTIETLLEAGADAFAVNRKGFTPLDVARQNGRKTAGAALLDHMKVHAGWLFLRGKFHWKKRWAVVVACNKQRTSTELCIFHRLSDLRPSIVMLIDEAARMIHFSSTDSYSWLQRDNAFVFDKPVMCHHVKREKFTRSPICKKTMSLADVETVHCVFAADSLNNLAQWRRVLESSNFQTREGQSALHLSTLFEAQHGELYYWPHELVENLRSTILQEQEQEREEANDPLYQRLRATFEERRPDLAIASASVPAPDTPNDLAFVATQTPTQSPPLYNESKESIEEPPQCVQRCATPTQPADVLITPKHDGHSRVHFTSPPPANDPEMSPAAQSSHTYQDRIKPNANGIHGSKADSVGPEIVARTDVMTGSEPRVSQPQRSSLQGKDDEDDHGDKYNGEEDNQDQHEVWSNLSEAPEDSTADARKILGMARPNAVCTPCGPPNQLY